MDVDFNSRYHSTTAITPSTSLPDSTISPLVLDSSWAPVHKLMIMFVITIISLYSNLSFFCTFFVEITLRVEGNIYLACTGMANLIISFGVLPITTVLHLAKEWVTNDMCRFCYFLVTLSTYGSSMFFALVGFESYLHHGDYKEQHKAFLGKRIKYICCFFACISFILAFLDVYLEFNYDYCGRKFQGLYTYRISTLLIFHILPSILGLSSLIKGLYLIITYARKQHIYRRSLLYVYDRSLLVACITDYLTYLALWAPHVYISHQVADASDVVYYYTAWLGVSRVLFTSSIYCIIHKSFKRAYAQIICYSCCRTTLNEPTANRHRRAVVNNPSETVSVHILAQALSVSTPHQRSASSSTETQGL